MPLESLTTISSIDGRYRDACAPLAEYFSEFALIRARVRVECEYLTSLSETKGVGIRAVSADEKKLLRKIADISLEDAKIVKAIEKDGWEGIPATNHDVKAIEYFIKRQLGKTSLADVSEWVHFALTSEDINSIAYGLLLRDFFEKAFLGGPLLEIEQNLMVLAKNHAATPMLARTHGQPASPTTFGKEMRVFAERLHRQVDAFKVSSILVKLGGATGNWSAHNVALPEVDWISFAAKFVDGLNAEGKDQKHYMRLELNEFTTQIESHDTYAEYFDYMRRINVILIDLSQDMWRYISDGWLTQKPKKGEVGSSTMPHKVNPIDFENAEGNFGVANALFAHFAQKLPISRLQRDLSDSTVERVFGTALAHSHIGLKALLRGLTKMSVNEKAKLAALEGHPEVIAEAIQTVMRKEGLDVPYEQLKELTRGREVTMDDFAKFIDSLDVAADVKKRLKAITPDNYIGLAEKIAKS